MAWIELKDVSYSYDGDGAAGAGSTGKGSQSGLWQSSRGQNGMGHGGSGQSGAHAGGSSLSHVTLSLEPGHTYVVTGPNGCGKSTLFRVLVGLSFPTGGHYIFRGTEITEKKMNDRKFSKDFYKKLGFLFQNSETQLFCKTVREEVAFGLFQLGLDQNQVEERTERYLDMLEITELAGRAPFHLSGGEKKRVALAAVLAMQPEVLILDEPEAGLDEEGEEWVKAFLSGLRSPDRLIVIATHSRGLAGAVNGEEIRMNRRHTLD